MRNEEILEQFYSSFQRGDAQAMSACYHDSVTFTDPAFGSLNGKEVGAMWSMLLSRKESELNIDYSGVSVNGESGEAYWIASYKYGRKKRPVVNKIHSRFKFRNGKIMEQVDDFDLWAWSRQTVGLIGLLLGWTPFLRNKIQTMARKALTSYMNEQKK